MWDSLLRDDRSYLSTKAKLKAYLSIASVVAAETSVILVVSVVCVTVDTISLSTAIVMESSQYTQFASIMYHKMFFSSSSALGEIVCEWD